jgi:V-type H+-transporting ATPase subunit a
MFGDVAHGLFLLIFGSYILLTSKSIEQNENSRLKVFLKAKYILPMMGFFAVYCGFIYNDFASMALPLSDSCYENKTVDGVMIGVRKKDCNYYFGIDHKWNASANDLSYMNSLKMKLSVIVGVFHMSLGIILKGCNCIFFNDYLGFWFEFIPQITFMLAVFGYMDFMIILKWLTDWTGRGIYAPNITASLLNIFLKLGAVPGNPEDDVSFS